MDIEQFRKAGYQAIDRICDYYYSLREKPVVAQVEPGYLRKALPDHAPEKGEQWDAIADDYQSLIIPGLTHWQHPSFFAYFPTGCTFEGMLADLYSSSACNPGFNWLASPACTELESVVMDWAARMLGLERTFWNISEVGGGVIQTTASDSALTAVVCARTRCTTLNPDVPHSSLVMYVTSHTHSFGLKAARILGLRVRTIDVDDEVVMGKDSEEEVDGWGLGVNKLKEALKEDLANGMKPFILVATVGTTNSGAVDRIDEIGEYLAKEHPSIWLHVDAAWAGVTLACPEYRDRAQLAGINKWVTSLCVNFHKWGLTNFDASALWVRDRNLLIDALDVTPAYLRTKHGDAGTVIDYRNWHLSLGRRFRSLKLWFVLRSFGVEGFQTYIRRCIKLNELFASLVRKSDIFELVTRPSFALTVFRLRPQAIFEPSTLVSTSPPTSSSITATAPTSDKEDPSSLAFLNALNRAMHHELQTSHTHEMLLTQTEIRGVFCLRLAVGAARTEERDILRAWEILNEVGEHVLAEAQSGA
ncbi:uncharacterized protein STEHIDRAFT_95546 [Stereum hirsutum FP-91666 SS1]|uniref:uncharacterized protein n=1 Tax=Stereum hirsutum (strain FP-91666) TaxID=721885 RepID=UPI000440AFC1|nr:uncharacterized protein STEHIDRAFT_95546 [Stereum hirsutum FP-91666 SS1]EIM88378.1 hypothetical protein STEHIDRAFT_95546 [Stereum hirsutum FP-91666 SS1]